MLAVRNQRRLKRVTNYPNSSAVCRSKSPSLPVSRPVKYLVGSLCRQCAAARPLQLVSATTPWFSSQVSLGPHDSRRGNGRDESSSRLQNGGCRIISKFMFHVHKKRSLIIVSLIDPAQETAVPSELSQMLGSDISSFREGISTCCQDIFL